MSWSVGELIGRILLALRTAGRAQLAARCLGLALGLALGATLVLLTPPLEPIALLLAWAVGLLAAAVCLAPDSPMLVVSVLPIPLWMLFCRPGWWQAAAIALLVWALRRCAAFSATAPLHARTSPDAVRMLLGDGARELLLLVMALGLLGAGRWLAGVLPHSALWGLALVVALLCIPLGVGARGRVGSSSHGRNWHFFRIRR